MNARLSQPAPSEPSESSARTTPDQAGPDTPAAGPSRSDESNDRERRCSRTPLSSRRPLPDPADDAECVVRVTCPGSYYLDRPIEGVAGKHGIIIEACGVSLDLNGYELVGNTDSGAGIVVQAISGAVICNGTIRRWGQCGVDASASPCTHAEGVRCIDNGGDGVRLGANSTADNLLACDNGGNGIASGPGCTLHDCQAFSNAGHGVVCEETCRVIDSSATANSGDGFRLGVGSQIRACAARHNLLNGVTVESLASVVECDTIGNEQDGIRATNQCVVSRCRSHGSRRGAGVRITGQATRVDENTCSENRVGIIAERSGNIITRNAISASATAAIEAVAANQIGRLVAHPDGVRCEVAWSNFIV